MTLGRKPAVTRFFSSLALVLPQPLTPASQKSLLELIAELDQRRKNNPEENGELSLHNLDLEKPESSRLLMALQDLADDDDLQIVIKLPVWDREAPVTAEQNRLKAQYRQLQDKVLDNQRSRRQAKLGENLRNLADCETRAPEQVIFERRTVSARPKL